MIAPSIPPLPDAAHKDAQAVDPWIGRVLDGRYLVQERLGEGGMGTVYVAEHITLRKQVALKLVHGGQENSADQSARFVREAMVTSRIDHPNVISAMDFGTFEDGTSYLAMQLVRGPTLGRVISTDGTVPWLRMADLGAQIADALLAAQSHGIVHRDLKPENIVLQRLDDGSELAKVLDFGIAKYARDSLAPPPMRASQTVTRIGMVVGTPGYMAPEQAVGKRADHRADLYSLGVILWECITGKRLWDHEDMQELFTDQFSRTPPLLRQASGDWTVPLELEALVAKLLARSANARPQNAAEVRDALRSLVSRAEQGLLPPVASEGFTMAPPPPPPPQALVQNEPTERHELASPSPLPSPVPDLATAPLGTAHEYWFESGRSSWIAAAVLLCVIVGIAWQVLAPSAVAPVVTKPAVAAVQVKTKPVGLANAVRPLVHSLIEGDTREARVAAAEALLRYAPVDEVPVYVRAMAHLQLAETCAQKKQQLDLMSTIDDPHTLPMLVALSQRKRAGCGPRGKEDCLACLRDELAALVARFEARQLGAK